MNLNKKCMLELNDINYVCKRIFGILNIPIHFFNSDGDLVFEYSYDYSYNPLYQNNLEVLNELLCVDDSKILKLGETRYYENYFTIKLISKDNFQGTLLVGPTCSSKIDEESIDLLIKECNIQVKFRKSLINYYNHLVMVDFNSFSGLSLLLYYIIYNQKLDLYDLLENNKLFIDLNVKSHKHGDILNTKNTIEFSFHHSQEYEKKLLDWIRNGDIEKIKEFTKSTTNLDGKKGLHSKNPLRNEKNTFISFSSLVARSAVEGGLDWELSLALSDFYIQTVESCNSIVNIYDLYEKMILDYSEKVHDIKFNNYSIQTIKCQSYILCHLHEKLSLSDIANYISMNPSYLSYLFKKEVGISITTYIQKEKIEESKKLIQSGKKSFADIYISLGFIDQSHFTKTFKKFVGISPKDYRLLHTSTRNT